MKEVKDSCSRVSKRAGTVGGLMKGPGTGDRREPLLALGCQLTEHVDDNGLEDTSNPETGSFVALAFPLFSGSCGSFGVPVLLSQWGQDTDVEANRGTFVIARDHIDPEILLPFRLIILPLGLSLLL